MANSSLGTSHQGSLRPSRLDSQPFRSLHSLGPRRVARRGRPICASEQEQQSEVKKENLVRSLPPVRQAAPPPEAVAVEHSSSYLYRQRQQELGETRDFEPRRYSSPERSARHEDAREVNAAAAAGIANAAMVTANVGKGVLGVAVPVGSWALRQGFKAATGALKKNSAKQSRRRQREGGSDRQDPEE